MAARPLVVNVRWAKSSTLAIPGVLISLKLDQPKTGLRGSGVADKANSFVTLGLDQLGWLALLGWRVFQKRQAGRSICLRFAVALEAPSLESLAP